MSENQLFEISLKTILKDDKGSILVLENSEKSWMYGFFDLPGGRIQKHEIDVKLHEVAQRELLEEVGNIKFEMDERPVSYGRHHYISKDNHHIHVIWIFFEAQYLGGEIKISEEHTGYRWVRLDEIDLEKSFVKDTGGYDGIKNYLKWTKL